MRRFFECWVTTACPAWMTVTNYRTHTPLFTRFSAVQILHPLGTAILANLTAILTDKEHWKYPDTFNPDHFLDDNGHFFKPESFLPFSLGPRVCLGETLAKMESSLSYSGFVSPGPLV